MTQEIWTCEHCQIRQERYVAKHIVWLREWERSRDLCWECFYAMSEYKQVVKFYVK